MNLVISHKSLGYELLSSKYEIRIYIEGICIDEATKPSFISKGIDAVSYLQIQGALSVEHAQYLRKYFVWFSNNASDLLQFVYTTDREGGQLS